MSMTVIYWDSDCFLSYFKAEQDKIAKCENVIKRAEEGNVLIVTSALTLAEVLWIRGEQRLPKEKADIIRSFFRRRSTRIFNVTRKIAEAAQELVWNNHIKPKDALHVATALHIPTTLNLKLDALETFDKSLIAKNKTVGTPPLIIREPQTPAQGSLNLIIPKQD